MNRIAYAVIAAVLVVGPWAGRARAEDEGKDGGRRGEFSAKMKTRLGLSDEQADKIKAAFTAEKSAVTPLRDQQKAQSRKLEEEVRDLASEKDIQATLDVLDAGRKAMMAERQKLESALASILKPSQRAKMRLLTMERMRKDSHGRRGERHERHDQSDRHDRRDRDEHD
jgi:Spy/CpxP family protein refolding chaperone